MIIPDHLQEKIDSDVNFKAAVTQFPQAWFGYFVRYPKQADCIRQWLTVKPKICVISGCKRTAKTSIASYLGSCWMTGLLDPQWPGARAMGLGDRKRIWNRKFNGERVGIIAGSSLDHVENVLLPMYRALIPPGRIKNWFSKTSKKIELHDRSKFIIRTYEQDIEEWKSGNSQFAHLDEEVPWNVMNEVMARSLSLNGKIIITVAVDDADISWLPSACENPKKIFGTDSFLHFKLGMEDVPDAIVPEVSKKQIYAQFDDTPLRNAIRKGDWSRLSGRWWSRFDANVHVIDPFPIPDHWLKARFCDAGFTAPTACLWVAMHPSGDIFVYREYYKKERTIDERCKDIIEMSGNTRQKSGDFYVEMETKEKYISTHLDHHEFKKDAITGDDLSYHYLRAGLNVLPSTTLGQEERREIINRWLEVDMTKDHFITHNKGAPSVYIFNTCINVIFEAQTKSVKRESTDRSSISEKKIVNRGDHSMDCLEYACCELEFHQQDVRDKHKFA